jgi:hypothetical protein
MKQNDEDFFTDWAYFELDLHVSGLIREGRVSHDPLNLGGQHQTEHILRIIRQISIFRSQSLAQSEGFTIEGMSGIGKWRII